jgi:hypothetical protein
VGAFVREGTRLPLLVSPALDRTLSSRRFLTPATAPRDHEPRRSPDQIDANEMFVCVKPKLEAKPAEEIRLM